MEDTLTCSHATFSQVFGRQGQLMQATVQSLNNLNDQIAQFIVTRPCSLTDEDEAFIPGERDTLRKSMTLMRHLLVDAQVPFFPPASLTPTSSLPVIPPESRRQAFIFILIKASGIDLLTIIFKWRGCQTVYN